MRNLLFGLAAAATLVAATPASAQVYFGADPGGVGVRVGPFGLGVGPDYWGYDPGYAYGTCHLVRSRIVTPSGHIVFRTHRVCD